MQENVNVVKIDSEGRREMATKTAYHHGNLRATLISAATVLLAQKGAAACTLRGVAAAAGVSQAAPYHHFKDKEDLLDAVVAAGFERLAALQEKMMRSARGDYKRLRANGVAYVSFAVAEPALFRLMFGRDYLRPSFQTRYHTIAERSFTLFAEACRAAFPRSANPAVFQLSAWSLTHGLASLLVDGRVAGLVGPALGKGSKTSLNRAHVLKLAGEVIDALMAPTRIN